MGKAGEKLVRTLKRKIQQNLSRKINIRIFYTTNKLAKFCSVKDKIPDDQKSNVIYHIKCPGCGEVYVGKTNCCLGKRLEEHGTRSDQPMHKHLSNCVEFQYLIGLHHLPDMDKNAGSFSADSYFFEAVKQNCKPLTISDDWLTLAYLEPLMAKKHHATINHGDKAMRQLNLF